MILLVPLQEEGNGISLSPVKRDVDASIPSPLADFPGFKQTAFSTPLKRYFYQEGRPAWAGCGTFALVEQ